MYLCTEEVILIMTAFNNKYDGSVNHFLRYNKKDFCFLFTILIALNHAKVKVNFIGVESKVRCAFITSSIK